MADYEDDFIAEQEPSSGGFSDFLDSTGGQEETSYAASSYAAPASPSFAAPASPSFAAPASPAVRPASASYTADSFDSQPSSFGNDALAKYRREHAEYLEVKDQKAEAARRAAQAKAAAALEEFNRKVAEKKAKHQKKNRDEQTKFTNDLENVLNGQAGNDWERVTALVDLKSQPVGRDTSRMRKLLIDLKH